MHHVREMLSTHPQRAKLDLDFLGNCIQECLTCAESCLACADACLGDKNVQELVTCIRLSQDCADICRATAAVLIRQMRADSEIVRRQLEACALVCEACGDECAKHADNLTHCRLGERICHSCEQSCNRMLLGAGTAV